MQMRSGLLFCTISLFRLSSATLAGFHVSDFTDHFVRELQAGAQPNFERMKSNFRTCLEDDAPILYGAACSGMDAMQHWLPRLVKSLATIDDSFQELATAHPAKQVFKQLFLCESDAPKINLLSNNDMLKDGVVAFKDITKLGAATATTWFSGVSKFFPWTSIFIGGFVCSTVSKLNKHHAKNKKCVKERKGRTSKTFWGTVAYIKAHMPRTLLLKSLYKHTAWTRIHIAMSLLTKLITATENRMRFRTMSTLIQDQNYFVKFVRFQTQRTRRVQKSTYLLSSPSPWEIGATSVDVL